MPLMMTPPDYLAVEEGTLTPDGEFIPVRQRNGDEAVFGGFWATSTCGVVRVRMTPNG
jgi:hypothetical protein